MRKYVIGCLVGFCLSFGVGAHAEVINMIGKTIDGAFPVTVQGNKLPVDAVVIEGITYLPVRAFGEAIGYTVGFDANLGVSLTKTVTQDTYSTQPVIDPKFQKIDELKKQSDGLTTKIVDLAQLIRPYESIGIGPDGGGKPSDDFYIKTKKEREGLLIQRDAIEQQIKALANQ